MYPTSEGTFPPFCINHSLAMITGRRRLTSYPYVAISQTSSFKCSSNLSLNPNPRMSVGEMFALAPPRRAHPRRARVADRDAG